MREDRYFLSVTIAGEKIEREVTLEEFCKAERAAGFRPKLWSGDPAYMTTPATGGFSSSRGISGRVGYQPNNSLQATSASAHDGPGGDQKGNASPSGSA